MRASTLAQGLRTTHWSIVEALRSGDEAERARANDTIARVYWPAIYTYLRQRGHERNSAEELTQDFFATVICGRRLFEKADSERGRLRSLLLTALRNFLVDVDRKRRSRADGAALRLDRIDQEERLMSESPPDCDAAFDSRWRALVLEQAVAQCRDSLAASGQSRHWEAFEARCLRPALAQVKPRSYREIAAEFGFGNEAAAAAAVQTVRRQLLIRLSEGVAATVDADQFESELAFVRGAL